MTVLNSQPGLTSSTWRRDSARVVKGALMNGWVMGNGDFLVWVHINWTGFNVAVARLHTPPFWDGWSCRSSASEMRTRHFNCNALICKRSDGKEGQRFPLSSSEGFSFEVALLIDPNPLSSCEWGWVWMLGWVSSWGFWRCVVQVQSCSLTRVSAEQWFTAPLCPCSSLSGQYSSLCYEDRRFRLCCRASRAACEEKSASRRKVSPVTTATTCKNAAQ